MLTHRLTRAWGTGSSKIEKIVEIQAGAEHNIDETIPASSTDLLVALALDVSQVKSLFIVASAAMTLETNSGSAAPNTITLSKDVPFLWIVGDGTLKDTSGTAISTDITALYVTSVDGGVLQLRALIDPTV